MQARLMDIQRVIPYARNPRHNEQATLKVATSIKEYGFRQPIVVDDEIVIIAGHTRLQAAFKLGLSQVPVHIATGLTPAQIKAYRIADNRTAQEAQWDDKLLALEIGGLSALGFNLDLTGFDSMELNKLLSNLDAGGLTDEDDVPETPIEPITKADDVWILGDHKLICGDSLDEGTLDILLGGTLVDIVFCGSPLQRKLWGNSKR